MIPDLSRMKEVVCPDCGKPLVVTQVEGIPNRCVLEGCGCGREVFDLPDCTLAGLRGGPLFLYVPLPQS